MTRFQIILSILVLVYLIVSGKWKKLYAKWKEEAKQESIENVPTFSLFLGGCFLFCLGTAVLSAMMDDFKFSVSDMSSIDAFFSFFNEHENASLMIIPVLFILVSIYVFFNVIKRLGKRKKTVSLKQILERIRCVDLFSKCVALMCLIIALIAFKAFIFSADVPLFVPFLGGAFFIGGVMFLFQEHK